MDAIPANRCLPIAILALLVAGCSPVQSPSPAPTVEATPTRTAAASPIASSWREVPEQASVSGVQFLDVVWTGTRFVAVGSGLDNAAAFLDSSDGITWHRQAAGQSGWDPMRLAAGPGGVVAVGSIGEHLASWFSPDGLTWAPRPDAFPVRALGADTAQVTDVVARGDGWLAVGRRDAPCQVDCGLASINAYAWTSSDGTHWTRIADQKAFTGGGMAAVARADDGFVAAGTASGHGAIWTSPDGLAWARVPDVAAFRGGERAGAGSRITATGVAARPGAVVVLGMLYLDPPEVRAWASNSGQGWSKASVENAAEGQVFSVAAVPNGFLATGPSGEASCLGGIWASTDGRAWRCDASAPAFKGFGPYAAAASDTVEVAVGLKSTPASEESPLGLPGAAWWRSVP